MSPEIYKNQDYGRATDIWSLGVILYQLCTLNYPFEANSIPAIQNKILTTQPPPIPDNYGKNMNNLLKSLLEKDPKKRPKIVTVLKFPKIAERIGSLLSNEVYQKEFL